MSFNVSAVGAAGGSAAASGITGPGAATWSGASRRAGGPGAVGRMQAAIGAVSQLLQTPPQELVRRLGGGQSLSSLAAARGVPSSTLLAAVTKAVATAVPQGAQPLSGQLLDSVASRIAGSTAVPAGLRVPPAG
jgi:hypothetical protein